MKCQSESLIIHVEIPGTVIAETPRNDGRVGILHVIVATRSGICPPDDLN